MSQKLACPYHSHDIGFMWPTHNISLPSSPSIVIVTESITLSVVCWIHVEYGLHKKMYLLIVVVVVVVIVVVIIIIVVVVVHHNRRC